MVEELEAARHLQQEFARHPSHIPLVQNKVSSAVAHASPSALRAAQVSERGADAWWLTAATGALLL